MAGLHQFKTETDYGSGEEICILHLQTWEQDVCWERNVTVN